MCTEKADKDRLSVVDPTEAVRITYIVSLIDTDQSVTQFKHVIAQRNDDAKPDVEALAYIYHLVCELPRIRYLQLSGFRLGLDIVCDDRHISEVECCIDLVHKVKRCRLWEAVRGEVWEALESGLP